MMADASSQDELRQHTDEPRYSSAALCIELNLLGQSFQPEFTHQCFAGEYIRGYQPFHERLPGNLRHNSYQHHEENARQELLIKVFLSPSGQTCSVEMETRKKRNLRLPPASQRSSKRLRRVLDECSENNKNGSSKAHSIEEEEYNNDDDDDESSVYNESSDEDEEEPYSPSKQEGATRKRCMPLAEIRDALKSALPDVVEEQSEDYLRRPVGTILQQYSRNGADFVLSLACGQQAAEYHSSVQKLAVLFIETADGVNVANDKEGYWNVLYLFRKHSSSKYSLAGYMTLFYFHSPFRKPTPGTVVRVCQVLILTPYQRAGHGREMLQVVHQLARGRYNRHHQFKQKDDIVEINVEDPAPAFVILRNCVDYEQFLRSKEDTSTSPWIESDNKCHITDPAFFRMLTEAQAMEAASRGKITPRQMQIVHELHKLHCLREQKSFDELLEKRFRLMIKKRLNKEHREELSACRNKQEMQEWLGKMYDKQLKQYEAILSSVHKK